MIKEVYQVDGENVLTVVYYSGARRFCYLGDSYYIIPETIKKFLENAPKTAYIDGVTVWG